MKLHLLSAIAFIVISGVARSQAPTPASTPTATPAIFPEGATLEMKKAILRDRAAAAAAERNARETAARLAATREKEAAVPDPALKVLDGFVLRKMSQRAVVIDDPTYGLSLIRGIDAGEYTRIKCQAVRGEAMQIPWYGSIVWVTTFEAK